MNRILLSLAFVSFCVTASSQKVYFIYLQSEAEQPFFVKMNSKVHSSSASGYLILSKLRDSSYSFSIGFPANKWPEQNFTVAVNKKDHGFLLKNFNEKGWGLFDLQTLTVQMPVAGSARADLPVDEKNDDVSLFTAILSKAADDPSLRQRSPVVVAEKRVGVSIPEVVKKEEPAVVKKEEVAVVTIKEPEIVPIIKEEVLPAPKEVVEIKITPEKVEPTVVKQEEVKLVNEQETVVKTESKEEVEIYKMSIVKRRSESSTTEGFGLVFIDELGEGLVDTIRLLIPNSKPVVPPQKSEPKEEKKFLDIPVADTAAGTAVVQINQRNVCPVVAVESDFFQARKTMAGEEKDDDMITAAQNFFKAKCFTTQQVKNLGALFLNDGGRYKFFDMAYPYISDKENFNILESEFKDPTYVSRFKAIVKQ